MTLLGEESVMLAALVAPGKVAVTLRRLMAASTTKEVCTGAPGAAVSVLSTSEGLLEAMLCASWNTWVIWLRVVGE